MLTLTLVAIRELIDLDKILDIEYKRRFNNRLYFACGLFSYWKNTYNPNEIVNLVLIPAY